MWVILAALAGAVLYRARGMGLWSFPHAVWAAVFALAYGVGIFCVVSPLAGAIVLAVTGAAVTAGHSAYLGLGDHSRLPADGQIDEWYGHWIPRPGTYWHDVAGLTVSGLLISAMAGLSLAAAGHFAQGLAVAASGALKGPAYAIGALVARPLVSDKLKVCEPLCGAALWGSLAAILTG